MPTDRARPVAVAARPFEDFTIGSSVSCERTISREDVDRFVELTGDENPVHVDDVYGVATGFRERIVHGMLTSAFTTAAIGTLLPGPGALCLSQRLNFRSPVYVGDRIRVELTIRRTSPGTRILMLDLRVTNADNEVVMDGEATVRVLQPG